MREKLHRATGMAVLSTLVVNLAVMGMLVFAQVAHADIVSGSGPVKNYRNGLCLDDTGWSTSQGTQIQLYYCTGGTNQNWHENIYTVCLFYICNQGMGYATVAMIQNDYSGLCLNVSGASNRNFTPAIQWGCNPNATNEQFKINPASGTTGPPNWQIKAARMGTCLDDPGQSAAIGTKLEFYQCNLTVAQIWVGPAWIGVGL